MTVMSTAETWWFCFCLFGVATGCAVLAICGPPLRRKLLQERGLRRGNARVSLVIVLLAGAIAVLAVLSEAELRRGRAARARIFESFRATTVPIQTWLELRRKEEGRYPQTLPEDFLQKLSRFTPEGEYSVSEDRSCYYLAMGDYDADGFTLYWSSETTNWHGND